MHELWDQVVEWERIPKGVCRNLIRSMPRRVGPVIKAKEGKTKYWQKKNDLGLDLTTTSLVSQAGQCSQVSSQEWSWDSVY